MYIKPIIDSPALQYQVTQRQIRHARVLDGSLYTHRMELLQMEPVQQVLARVNCRGDTTTAAPDIHGDLPDSEGELVSDDDEAEGGEVESIPDESDYFGNIYDEYEMVQAVQDQQVEVDLELVLNESNPDIDGPLWGEIKPTRSDRPNKFRPPPSPPSPSPNRLPLVSTPSLPPSKPPQEHPPNGGPSATPEPSRVSGRFHLVGEIITEFESPTQWMQGAMVQVFGEALCQRTHSHSRRAHRVDILPSDLPEKLKRLERGFEGDRRELEMQIRQCLRPDHCGMWLIPICHKSHWWLIKIDWISESVLILDSLSSRGLDATEVLTLAQKIIAKIHEVLEKPYVPWSSFSLDPVSPNVLRVSPSLHDHHQRPPRQTNANDCGPHLAFDIACLANTGQLSALEESSVPDWRRDIIKQLRRLPVYDPRKPRLIVCSDEVIDLT